MTTRSLRHEINKKRDFELAEQEASLNIVRTAAAIACAFDRLFRRYGLSEATYNALRILRGHGPAGVPSQTIGAELVAAVPDVTRIVDRLVKSGWAQRTRTENDRRVVIVRVTKAGLELLSHLDSPVLELHKRHLGHMSPKDLKTISRLLVEARAGAEGNESAGARGTSED